MESANGFKLLMKMRQSVLKLEKKCNFKSTKTHYLHFQKWQKINICARKKSGNCIFGTFSSCKKIDFLPFLKQQKMCFCTFEIALFSNFRAPYSDYLKIFYTKMSSFSPTLLAQLVSDYLKTFFIKTLIPTKYRYLVSHYMKTFSYYRYNQTGIVI